MLGSGTRAFVLKRDHVRHGIYHHLNSLTGPVRAMSLGFLLALERQETPHYSIMRQHPLIQRPNSEQITQNNLINGPNYLLETHGSLPAVLKSSHSDETVLFEQSYSDHEHTFRGQKMPFSCYIVGYRTK